MEQMTLEQAKRIAQEGDYGLVPLTRELYADAITPTEVMRILKELNQDGKTVVLITHDNEVAAQARRVVRIHDGRLAQDCMLPVRER